MLWELVVANTIHSLESIEDAQEPLSFIYIYRVELLCALQLLGAFPAKTPFRVKILFTAFGLRGFALPPRQNPFVQLCDDWAVTVAVVPLRGSGQVVPCPPGTLESLG